MIGLAELLLMVAIVLLVFGTTRLSRAADTTKAAVKVGKKRFWVTNPVSGEKELTLMSVDKELALGKRNAQGRARRRAGRREIGLTGSWEVVAARSCWVRHRVAISHSSTTMSGG